MPETKKAIFPLVIIAFIAILVGVAVIFLRPMIQGEQLTGPLKGVTIQGIMHQAKGDSVIVINSEMYRVGDFVQGFKVTKIDIESETIVLLKDGKDYEIQVGEAASPSDASKSFSRGDKLAELKGRK